MATKGPVLWPVLLMAGISGAVVAAVAIYASYSHMHDLVLLTGEDEDLARIVPASIDALVIFAAAVAWAQRRAGEKVHPMAPAAGWIAGGVSLSANVVSKWPAVATSPLARVLVAAWPAIAVIVMGHLGVQLIGLVLRERRVQARPAPARTLSARTAPERRAEPTSPEDKPVQRPPAGPSLSDADLVKIAEDIPDLSRAALQAAVTERHGRGVGNNRAARAVQVVQAQRAASGNGTGQP